MRHAYMLQVPQQDLLRLLEGIGSGIGMDASIVPSHKYPDMSVISTTDFFYPLVEDPYEQVRIASHRIASGRWAG